MKFGAADFPNQPEREKLMLKRRLSCKGALGAAVVTFLLAGALLQPLVAEAAPVKIKCGADGQCHQSCSQQLPNGDTAYYDHGSTVTVRDGVTGEEITFKCNEGKWEKTSTIQLPQFQKGLQLLGNIGVGAIAGIQGDVTGPQCSDTGGGDVFCQDVTFTVGPPGRTVSDGCLPNQVTCFP